MSDNRIVKGESGNLWKVDVCLKGSKSGRILRRLVEGCVRNAYRVARLGKGRRNGSEW